MAIRDDLITDPHNRKIKGTLGFRYSMIPEERLNSWANKETTWLEEQLERIEASYNRRLSRHEVDHQVLEELEGVIKDLSTYIEKRYADSDDDSQDILV